MSAPVEPLVPMNRASLQPSRRLRAAAVAERDGLQRSRAKLLAKRERLNRELAALDAELAEVEDRMLLIGRIAGEQAAPGGSRQAMEPVSAAAGEMALRGPAIREVAIRVLLDDARRPEALHYREWFELLGRRGYLVQGKDPLAVFLTQLNRSPVVRRGTQSGVYELDVDAPARIRRRLDELQQQLGGLGPDGERSTTNLGQVRSRRTAVTREIDKLEKALEEAELVLGRRHSTLAEAS
jgi:hypothetical protein